MAGIALQPRLVQCPGLVATPLTLESVSLSVPVGSSLPLVLLRVPEVSFGLPGQTSYLSGPHQRTPGQRRGCRANEWDNPSSMRRLLLVILAFVVLAGGCGSDAADNANLAATSSTTPPTPDTTNTDESTTTPDHDAETTGDPVATSSTTPPTPDTANTDESTTTPDQIGRASCRGRV